MGEELRRCGWVDAARADYVAYHDREWGVPLHDDRSLFELLVLEGAQAGLSWYTVLSKRANYRRAFAGFDIERVAEFGPADIARFLLDPGLIRHRGKLEAAVNNAIHVRALQREFGSFDRYLWSYVDGAPLRNRRNGLAEVPARSPISDALSRDLKRRGFRFVGSTTIYAFMQAVGMVNDHVVDCFRYSQIVA